jgi:hypothetical protein
MWIPYKALEAKSDAISTGLTGSITQIEHMKFVSRVSSVGIATDYRLDCPEIESRWWRNFPHPSTPALGVHPAYCRIGTEYLSRGKAAGRGVEQPSPTSAEVKECLDP